MARCRTVFNISTSMEPGGVFGEIQTTNCWNLNKPLFYNAT